MKMYFKSLGDKSSGIFSTEAVLEVNYILPMSREDREAYRSDFLDYASESLAGEDRKRCKVYFEDECPHCGKQLQKKKHSKGFFDCNFHHWEI